MGAMSHWNNLPWEAVDSLTLDTFKIQLGKVPGPSCLDNALTRKVGSSSLSFFGSIILWHGPAEIGSNLLAGIPLHTFSPFVHLLISLTTAVLLKELGMFPLPQEVTVGQCMCASGSDKHCCSTFVTSLQKTGRD